MIHTNNLNRTFQRYKHQPGLKGTLKGFISRQKETVEAVNNVSFQINAGEFIGYIGPNGAGKSTTIKMLTGILTPTSGTVQVDGRDPVKHRLQNAKIIGTVFGQRSQLWWDLPIMDTYALFKHMYKVDTKSFEARVETLKELLDLNEFWDAPVRQLSLGQRMRGELGAALIHQPKVLFLDEPTIGMDVVVKEQIKKFLKRINEEQGVTILLTTHDLKDVEDLCSRSILINRGKVLFDGALAQIRENSSARTKMELEFTALPKDLPSTKPYEAAPGLEVSEADGRQMTVLFQRSEFSPVQVIEHFSKLGTLNDVRIIEPPIEDVIADYYR